jgi:hypothetical protein
MVTYETEPRYAVRVGRSSVRQLLLISITWLWQTRAIGGVLRAEAPTTSIATIGGHCLQITCQTGLATGASLLVQPLAGCRAEPRGKTPVFFASCVGICES